MMLMHLFHYLISKSEWGNNLRPFPLADLIHRPKFFNSTNSNNRIPNYESMFDHYLNISLTYYSIPSS